MHRYGYNARDNGYLFAFIGVIAAVLQGGVIGRLVKYYGELPFIVLGAAFFVVGLLRCRLLAPRWAVCSAY
ncbi:MAG: hypothetical protein WKF84_25635 [Pyrinomonadaceae bacterium]